MTVQTTTNTIEYAMNGVAVNFAFTYRALIATPEDIKAQVTDTTTDITTDLIYNDAGSDGYSVEVDSDGVGGSITVNDARSSDYELLIYRETEIIQESDYNDYNQFPAQTLEVNLDKLTIIDQQQQEEIDRAIKLALGAATGISVELPSPVATNLLGWNATEDAIINYDNPGFKAGIDVASTPDYVGATSGDGFLRTGTGIAYADGGDFVTLTVDADYTDISANDAATDVTGAELETLSDGSNADALHTHSGLSINHSLDDAYDDGSTVTVDTGIVTWNSSVLGTHILNSTANGSHLRLTGDPVVAAPVDGDLWWTGTALNFYDGATTTDILAGGTYAGQVGIDAGATPGYLGAANNDGVLRTDGTITYTDGGDFVTLNVTDNTSVQQVEVVKNSGAVVGTRPQLNFIEGANITLTIADDAGNDQVDITIAASGGGATGTRGTFTNASLVAGVLTITHTLGLSTPFTLLLTVADNNQEQIIPDSVKFLTNTIEVDLTSYGTLAGTWGYYYI